MNIGITSQQQITTINEAVMVAIPIAFVIAIGGATIAANIMCGWGRVQGFSWTWNSLKINCR